MLVNTAYTSPQKFSHGYSCGKIQEPLLQCCVHDAYCLIGKALRFSAAISPFGTHIRDSGCPDSMAYLVTYKRFFPVTHPALQAARRLSVIDMYNGSYRMSCLFPKLLLCVWLDHFAISPWIPKRLPDNPPADMRNLRRRDDHVPALFHIRITDKILDMTMLHGRCLIPALHFDQPWLFLCFFKSPLWIEVCFQYISRIVFMKLRSVLSTFFLYIQHNARITSPDQPQRLSCRHFILRNNCCHIIPVKPHMLR